jgi:hypothetical protein
VTTEPLAPRAFITPLFKPRNVTRNTVQVNVCVIVDVAQVLATCSLEGGLMLIDNSVTASGAPSPGRGTADLATQCTYGTVVNWILHTVAPYGEPMPVTFADIRFEEEVCFKLARYGEIAWDRSPDAIPNVTPSYDYWAGLVIPDLEPKRYPYTIELQIGYLRFAVSTPSLDVWTIPAPSGLRGERSDGSVVTSGEIG